MSLSTTPSEITAAVVSSFESCRDERVRELMQSLVRHLHAFALEAELSEQEWEAAIFDSASDYLGSDAVFAVKPSLFREFVDRSPDDAERPSGVTGEWCSVENDMVPAPS